MKTSIQELSPTERRARLEAALLRMMSRQESEQPFVVLEHMTSRQFVQFCGSRTRPLIFDVPALDLQEELGPGSDPMVYVEAVRRAFETLGALVFTGGGPVEQLAGMDQTRMLVLTEHPDVTEERAA